MSISDATSFRSNVAGGCLIGGSLLLVIATLVSPYLGGETEEYVASMAENPGRQQASSLMSYLGFALLVPGLFGILHLFRAKAVALAHVAVALTFFGVVGLAALSLTGIPDVSTVENAGREQAVAAIDGIDDYTGAIVMLILTLAGVALGLLLLALALWRGGAAPAWVSIVIAVAVVVIFVAGEERVASVIANALLLVGFGFLGWRMLSMPNRGGDSSGRDRPTAAAEAR